MRMSAIPQAGAAASSSYTADRAREATPLRKEIRTKIGLELNDPYTTSIENQLTELYPGLALGRVLGKGAFSTAYLCTFRRPDGTEEKVVLKLASMFKPRDQEQFSLLGEERVGGEFMALLDFGEHVVKTERAIAYDVVNEKMIIVGAEEVQKLFYDPEAREGKKWVFLGSVSQFVEGSSDFYEAIAFYRKPFSTQAISNYARQILEGIIAIHAASGDPEKPLLHRDIKPDNMLFIPPKGMNSAAAIKAGEGKILFLDFGFAKMVEQGKKRHTMCGSPPYAAPEILLGEEYTPAVEAYSVASVLSVMATLKFHFCEEKHIFWAAKRGVDLFKAHMDESSAVDPKLKDLIKQLGHPNPDQRMSIKDALEHSFIRLEPVATTASSSTTSPSETEELTLDSSFSSQPSSEEESSGGVGNGFAMVVKPDLGLKKPTHSNVCSIQ